MLVSIQMVRNAIRPVLTMVTVHLNSIMELAIVIVNNYR